MPEIKSNGRYCCVTDCTGHSDYDLFHKWGAEHCEKHQCLRNTKGCTCTPPYFFNNLPTEAKKPEERRKWFQLINRKIVGTSKLWVNPPHSARVCSDHFVDGSPTAEHPYPTLKLGYDAKRKVEIITGEAINSTSRRNKKRAKISEQPTMADLELSINHDHSYISLDDSHLREEEVDQEQQQGNETISTSSDMNHVLNLFTFIYFLYLHVVAPLHSIVNFVATIVRYHQQRMTTINFLRAQIISLKEENERLARTVDRLEKKGNCAYASCHFLNS